MKTGGSVQPTVSGDMLMLWLACGLAVAGLYTWAFLSDAVQLGLGWSVRPGFVVVGLLVVLGAVELNKVRWSKLAQVLLLLVAATLVEFLDLRRVADSFLGITLTLFGMTILFASVQKVRVLEVLLLLVSSYIQSVWLYNLFAWGQMMHFFKPGWTF